ncbi:MAG: hypothetical protein ACR2OF_00670 [Hyphomicrobium sp.]
MFPPGATSASLIIVILIGAAVGAGGLLEGVVVEKAWLAIIAGFVATIVAGIIRNALIHGVSGAGPDTFKIPGVVLTFAVIASLAGSLTAHEILDDYDTIYTGEYSGIWLGTVSAIFSCVLMSMLMITFYLHPRSQP